MLSYNPNLFDLKPVFTEDVIFNWVHIFVVLLRKMYTKKNVLR